MPRKPKWAQSEDPLARLVDFVERLERSGIKHAEWIAKGIRARLNGTVDTIDQGLELNRRGPKPKAVTPHELRWGKRIFLLELQGTSWLDIQNDAELAQIGFPWDEPEQHVDEDPDESTLRQRYSRIRVAAMRALVNDRLQSLAEEGSIDD
jgi:hypothetical protein